MKKQAKKKKKQEKQERKKVSLQKKEKKKKEEFFSISLKDEKGILPFSVKKASLAKTMQELDVTQVQLERFIRFLEKGMHEVIWYIGTDMLGERCYERFMFSRNGFMEIFPGRHVELKAYFPNSKRAEKFRRVLKKALSKILRKKASQLIKDIK